MSNHKKLLDQNKFTMPKRYEESKTWFDTKLKDLSSAQAAKKLGNNIILFNHMPKNKKKSNYSELFPIIFPIKITKDEITGFNLHYIPHIHRAYLFDNIMKDKEKDMEIGSGFLKSSIPMKMFSPSLKKYSHRDIKSKIIQLSPDDWKHALFLPTQK